MESYLFSSPCSEQRRCLCNSFIFICSVRVRVPLATEKLEQKAFFSNWSRIFILNLISCRFWVSSGENQGRKLELGRVVSDGTSRSLILKTLGGFAAAAWIREPFNLLLIKMIFPLFSAFFSGPKAPPKLVMLYVKYKMHIHVVLRFHLEAEDEGELYLLFCCCCFRASDPSYRAAFQALLLYMFSMSCSPKCKHCPSINSFAGYYI